VLKAGAFLGVWGPVPRKVAVNLGSALLLFTFAYGVPFVWRRRIRQSLREQLRLLGIPVCDKCGYDLRGSIEAARCPECGTPFVPPNLPGATPTDAPDEQRGESVGPSE
jgi:hypothetical protein